MKTNFSRKINKLGFLAEAFLLIAIIFVNSIAPVSAQVMNSSNYSVEFDSVNFGGGRSSSGSYVLENTAGEVGTGYSNSTNNYLHAGFEQTATSSASTSTPAASSPASSARSGSSGSVPFPVNAIDFKATAKEKSIELSWRYPVDGFIDSVVIVRSDKFFPGGIEDGKIIFEGNAEAVIDYNVTPGVRYYYALFTRNIKGDYSSGVLAQARISPPGDVTPPVSSEDIFEEIKIIPTTDKQIAELTLADFDFIQDNRRIESKNGIVPIDGSRNLTIRLSYGKVPEILKTIAFTLTDPEDKSKVFSFLLRVNKDKTAYEATLAPLGKSGDYKLSAIILDYENQGLKRFNGSLRALVLDAGGDLLNSVDSKFGKSFLMYVFLFVALIAIVIFVIIEKRKRDKKEENLLNQ